VVGSVPFGHSHRFANGGEFAIDIVDIRRDDSGAFSTSRVPSPMVILGSDKVYEVDPMICPECGSEMKVVAFITDYQAVDRIIDHLKLQFIAEKPPSSRVFQQVALTAAEEQAEYF